MYVRRSFRVQKHAKLGKNGVFLVMFINFGKGMTEELRKNMQKLRI